MAHPVPNAIPRKNRTIVLPFDQAQYEELLISPEAFRRELDTHYQMNPELLPATIGSSGRKGLGSPESIPASEFRQKTAGFGKVARQAPHRITHVSMMMRLPTITRKVADNSWCQIFS